MPIKRKKPSLSLPTNKRQRQTPDATIEIGVPGVFKVREILAEDPTRYKIAWEDIGDVVYSPTWEPKSNANRAAIRDWEKKKKRLQKETTQEASQENKSLPRLKLKFRSKPATNSPTEKSPSRPPSSHSQIPVPRPDPSSIFSSQEEPPTRRFGAFRGTRSRQSQVQVQISPLRSSQRRLYEDSSLPSSQVITGTAPEKERSPLSSQRSARSTYLDAAAAPDLTQKHSQYRNIDASVDSIPASSHDFPPVSANPKRRSVVPDSQSGNTSLLGPEQSLSVSNTTNGNSTLSNINVNNNPSQIVDDISDWSPHSNQGRSASRRSGSRTKQTDTLSNGGPLRATPPIVLSSGVTNDSQLDLADESHPSPSISAITHERIGTPTRQIAGRSHSRESSASALSVARSEIARRLHLGTQSQPRSSPRSPAIAPAVPSPAQLGSPFQEASEAPRTQLLARRRSQDTSSGPVFETQLSRFRSPQNGQAKSKPSDLWSIFSRLLPGKKSQPSTTISSDSPIPGPPNHHPDTYNSAPDRPDSISDIPTTPPRNMTSEMAEEDVSARIQELREAGGPITPAQRSLGMTTRSSNRANSPAGLRGGRSPSVVPSAEVIPMPTEEEDRTSERYPTLFPDQETERRRSTLAPGITDDSSVDGRAESELENGIEMEVPQKGSKIDQPLEFAVPVFFLAQQRDHYKNSIVWKRDFIEKFLEQNWPQGSPMTVEANNLIDRLHQVISHPDLMNEETFSQVDAEPAQKAQYDKGQSAKILFISLLLAELSDENLHVVIDVSAGRLLNILDQFLTGIGVQHIVAGETFADETKLRVTLLPKDSPAAGVAKAHLVIAFEGSIDLIEDQRKALRSLPNGVAAPLVYLVVPKTVEHIQRQLRAEPYASLPSNKRQTILIENVARLRLEAGYRQVHDQDRKNAAASIARFIVDGQDSGDWPVDDLPDLNIVNTFTDSQATTESELASQVVNKSSKRALDDDGDGAAEAKKVRIDNHVAIDLLSSAIPASIPVSTATGSVGAHISTGSEYALDVAARQQEHEAENAALSEQIAVLSEQNFSLNIRLQEHISALEGLQYRHEEQRTELVKFQSERDAANDRINAMTAQMTTRETLLTKVKTEREEYKNRVAEAEAALMSHAVPEVAEFQALKTRAAEAEKEKMKLETRVKNLLGDLEYTRNLYQDVSSKGSQVIEERNDLESRVADLEKRASDNRNAALRISAERMHKQLTTEINRLKLNLADREKVLAKREDEMSKLREKERGRMTTRGGSVPRSPLGSPMRLEPPRSSGGMSTSRGASPIRRGSPALGAIGSSTGKSRLGR